MSCRILKSVCKTEAETKPWGFDYAGYDSESGTWGFLARVWSPGTSYDSGVPVRPSLPTGLQYSSSGGYSATNEPRWPTTVAGTVTDGSITWTAEAIDNDSLLTTIASSVWAADDSSITISDESLENTDGKQIVAAQVAGGVAGQEYEVSNVITLADGTAEESILRVKVA